MIGALVSCRLATLHELETIYSLEDAYLLLEVVEVDGHNRRIIEDHKRKSDG